ILKIFRFSPQVVFTFLAVWLVVPAVNGALIDTWRASDLDNSLADGAAVSIWNSQLGRELSTSDPGRRPSLRKNATPSGGSAVRFDEDRLRTTSSPVGGLSSFSMA